MRGGFFALAAMGLVSSCTDRIILKDYPSTPDAGVLFPDSSTYHDGGDKRGPGMGDAVCPTQYEWIRFDKEASTVMIAMDRSSSAGLALGSSTKSAAMQNALQYALVEKGYQSSIKFGFIEYPGPTSQCGMITCCASKQIVLPIFHSYLSINNWIRCDQYSSQCPPVTADAPLHAALFQASDYLELVGGKDAGKAQYLIVFSAAEPSCAGKDNTCDSVLSAAAFLADQNVNILTLAVGWLPGSNSCLRPLSQVKPWSSSIDIPRLYSPQSEKDLSSNLETILAAIGRNICTLELKQTIDLSRQVIVLQDGAVIPTTGPDRWEFDQTNTQIHLQGQSCDSLMKGTVKEVKIAYACSSCAGSDACLGRMNP